MTFVGLGPAPVCVVHYSASHDAILFPAADVSECSGEAGDEDSHPSVFVLGHAKLTRLQGLIVQNLAMAPGQNFLWSGHGSSSAWKEPNVPLESAFQMRND